MSIILSIFLYLLLFILTIILLLIIFPISYSFSGGYHNHLFGSGNIILLKFCKISVLANTKGLVSKLTLFGFSINIDPETTDRKFKAQDFEAKKPLKKKQLNQHRNHLGFVNKLLQKDIILHIFSLIKDLLFILKPQVLKLTGKIGFSEPHYTAWLEALLSTLVSTKANYHLDLETVWEEEYYQINLLVQGQLIILKILVRILKFIISKNTWQIWRIYRSGKNQRRFLQHEV